MKKYALGPEKKKYMKITIFWKSIPYFTTYPFKSQLKKYYSTGDMPATNSYIRRWWSFLDL